MKRIDITAAAFEALLAKHGGRIGPAVLLEDARDPTSPFHDYFEWDDDEAAERYRLAQASQLIRRWKGSIVRVDADTKTVRFEPVRRVQSPSSQRAKAGASYELVESIMADPAKRDDMIRTVLRELQAYRKRYSELVALSDVWRAIDDAVDLHMDDERRDRPGDEPEARV